MSQIMANMVPTWVQDGAMLGSKTVPRGQKTNRVAGWGRVVVGVGRRGGTGGGRIEGIHLGDGERFAWVALLVTKTVGCQLPKYKTSGQQATNLQN